MWPTWHLNKPMHTKYLSFKFILSIIATYLSAASTTSSITVLLKSLFIPCLAADLKTAVTKEIDPIGSRSHAMKWSIFNAVMYTFDLVNGPANGFTISWPGAPNFVTRYFIQLNSVRVRTYPRNLPAALSPSTTTSFRKLVYFYHETSQPWVFIDISSSLGKLSSFRTPSTSVEVIWDWVPNSNTLV